MRAPLCLAVPLVLLALGCVKPRPAAAPLRTLEIRPATDGSRDLIVLLPGRRDRPEDFARAGFGELAARAGVRARMVAVDAHLGYYFQRTIVGRLREDVIAPARAAGAERIWLAGVSIGGTGSLLYAIEHPEDVQGLLLLAPFLGEEKVIDEVAAAGGLRGYEAPEPLSAADFQRRIWRWLGSGDRDKIPVYLGWGKRDRFARANSLLGETLPPERVFNVPGGHGWGAWRAVWEAFLKTGALQGL